MTFRGWRAARIGFCPQGWLEATACCLFVSQPVAINNASKFSVAFPAPWIRESHLYLVVPSLLRTRAVHGTEAVEAGFRIWLQNGS